MIIATLASIAGAAPTPPSSSTTENRRCLNCHGQHHIAELDPEERAKMIDPSASPSTRVVAETTTATARPALYLSPDALASSVHAGLACVNCHPDAEKLPHRQRLEPPRCATECHAEDAAAFRQSRHAEAVARGDRDAPTCATCHGGHDIRPKSDRHSRVFPLNAIKTCGTCHERHLSAEPAFSPVDNRVRQYLDSVHGTAVSQSGLLVAATCVDCHGSHAVLPVAHPRSSVARENIPETCGACHLGVAETYAESIHGQKLAAGDTQAPVCTDCHTAHGITHASTPGFMLDIVGECGQCHDETGPNRGTRSSFYKTYRQSYHGQVTELGSTRAARCSDCHGTHDIRPIADVASPLHSSHRIEACRRCHPGADARFALFEPHADYRDAERYPLLHAVWLYFIVVMGGAFGFFGLHSFLWFIRSVIERIRHGPYPRYVANPHAILRFTRLNRINHAFVIVSFFGLTLTGLPLFFSDQAWAKTLFILLGGVRVAGVLHRFFGVMLLVNLVVHLVGLGQHVRRVGPGGFRNWLIGPGTILPRGKDFRDCAGMFRWFFRGGRKPTFDRWTYWEKFDYAGEIFGTLIIGGSGLLLWFPAFFSALLPGWAFNVAAIIHGYEALLAIGFIFTVHFFNAHLRPEKFPVDDVIFTGRLSEGEFRHERGAEFARLVQCGELDALKVPPAPPWQRKAAVVVGLLAMTIGTSLVVLIILAGVNAL